MLDFFKKRFARSTSQDDVTIEDEKAKKIQQEEVDVIPPPQPSQICYGLPEDFWPILVNLPLTTTFGSDDVPRIRESDEYQEQLLAYLKKPQKNHKDLSHYQTPQYQLQLKRYQQSQENSTRRNISIPNDTSIESLEVLLEDITLTSNRRL
jgi:hypothetical protein